MQLLPLRAVHTSITPSQPASLQIFRDGGEVAAASALPGGRTPTVVVVACLVGARLVESAAGRMPSLLAAACPTWVARTAARAARRTHTCARVVLAVRRRLGLRHRAATRRPQSEAHHLARDALKRPGLHSTGSSRLAEELHEQIVALECST